MVEAASIINFDAWGSFQNIKKKDGKKGIPLMKERVNKSAQVEKYRIADGIVWFD